MNALGKTIIKTACLSFGITAVAISYIVGIFAVCFPSVMGSFFDTVGNTRLSAVYYERDYLRDKDNNEKLYYTLDKFIASQNQPKIIKYSEKMFALDEQEYNRIIDAINKVKLERAQGDPMVIGRACNEDDRIRCAYIRALLDRNEGEDYFTAIDVMREAMTSTSVPSYAIYEFKAKIDISVVESDYNFFWSEFVAFHTAFVAEDAVGEFFKIYGKNF